MYHENQGCKQHRFDSFHRVWFWSMMALEFEKNFQRIVAPLRSNHSSAAISIFPLHPGHPDTPFRRT